ncbi:MAG: MFS transporter [Pseudomonadota bacterium]
MLKVLANRTYRHLFLAQVIALVGTGLATVAIGLLAYQIAGKNAGAVLGTALAIKMVAYVVVSPIAGAFAEILPRRKMLVLLDLLRAAVACALPFVSEAWQIYVLIFLLQSASAAFTPTFQATIPEILPDEAQYTRALSLSRLAYDLENLLSPVLAALLLTIVSFHVLFAGTIIGFLVSALLVVSVTLPKPAPKARRSFFERTTRGIRSYFATPRLRALFAISLAVSAAGSMVIVNTVVFVQARFGLGQQEVAWAMAAFGGGSVIAALLLPRILDRVPDRPVMLVGAAFLPLGLVGTALLSGYGALVSLWLVTGLTYAVAQTPSGRLLRRSSNADNRPALFAAHFAISHSCWLLTYPLAGWVGASFGLPVAAIVLAIIAAVGVVAAFLIWPSADAGVLLHSHVGLADDDPHWAEAADAGSGRHRHDFVIDALHTRWPEEPSEAEREP